jgi:hypothetical protein
VQGRQAGREVLAVNVPAGQILHIPANDWRAVEDTSPWE